MEPRAASRPGPLFWLSAAVGWVLVGVGVRGILSHRIDTRPAQLARFVAGGILIHDLFLAPVVILFGVALARVVAGRARPFVQAALVITAVVGLFSYPLVRAFGKATHNPTSLPHNYAANLSIVIGLVWAGTFAAAVFGLRRRGAPRKESNPS